MTKTSIKECHTKPVQPGLHAILIYGIYLPNLLGANRYNYFCVYLNKTILCLRKKKQYRNHCKQIHQKRWHLKGM